MATAKLRKFLEKLQDGDMFAARDVLHLHRRANTVYGALYRLTKAGAIFRVAQGLYIKGNERTPKPTIAQIAHAKAEAFCKAITDISAEFARAMGIEFEAKSEAIFATNGRSSLIQSCHGPIQFVGASLRKTALQDSPLGIQLRTMWHLGRHADPAPFVQMAVTQWSEVDWDESNARFKLLPYWLSAMLALPLVRPGNGGFLLE